MNFLSYQPRSIPQRPLYIRYADDWVLTIAGSFEQTIKLKQQISRYVNDNLKMELDQEKTKITKTTDGFNFLGFTYKMFSSESNKLCKTIVRNKNSTTRITKRTTSRMATLTPHRNRVLNNLHLRGYCSTSGYPIGSARYAMLTEYEIVLHYSQVMRGIFNYYRHLKNLSVINYVFYILKFSCAKTLARRQRISMSKILTKYGPQLNIKLILNKNGKDYTRNIKLPILSKLKKEKVSLKYKGDYDPFYVQKFWRTSIKLYGNCCICNSDTDISMHHLNSLKKLKQKNNQNNTYIRSALGRKQIPVCKQCHLDITNGKYNKESPIQLFEKYILL